MKNSVQYGSVLLGVWLFVSAFAWPHTVVQMTSTWVLGVMCVLIALVAMIAPSARYLNMLLSLVLFVSAFTMPTMRALTVWNNLLVAIAIFLVSLSRPPRGSRRSLLHHT